MIARRARSEAIGRDTRHSHPCPGVRNHRVATLLTIRKHPSTMAMLGRRVLSELVFERCATLAGLAVIGSVISTNPFATRHARYTSQF